MNPNKPVLSLSSRPAKRPGCDADAGDAEHGHRDLPGAPAQSVNGRGQAAGEDGRRREVQREQRADGGDRGIVVDGNCSR